MGLTLDFPPDDCLLFGLWIEKEDAHGSRSNAMGSGLPADQSGARSGSAAAVDWTSEDLNDLFRGLHDDPELHAPADGFQLAASRKWNAILNAVSHRTEWAPADLVTVAGTLGFDLQLNAAKVQIFHLQSSKVVERLRRGAYRVNPELVRQTPSSTEGEA